MKTLTLSKSFTLQNGKEITEVTLDFEALTTADFRQVRRLEALIIDNSPTSVEQITSGGTFSNSFRVASGFLAAVKGTPGLSIDDFLKLPMKDTTRMGLEAAFFWAGVD